MCYLDIKYPDRTNPCDQDEEFIHLCTRSGKEKIRIHDYDRFYTVPGLYEEVVYNKLECDSPRVITDLLKEEIKKNGAENHGSLRVLDFGAGNGIVGEHLKDSLDCQTVVGVDIIEEARQAAKRDRPDLYDDYYVMDLSSPTKADEKSISKWQFNALVTVAALGFGDIPTQAFINAYNMVDEGSWVAFNIRDKFLKEDDDTGYAETIHKMVSESLNVYRQHHYCHRLSMSGEPIHYYAIIGRKETAFSPAV